MLYTIHQLDGRHSYRNSFQYYIEFAGSMNQGRGPLYFNQCMTWFIHTYGWSAEIRQYHNLSQWVANGQRLINQFSPSRAARGLLDQAPEFCNPSWSWSNAMGNGLRIYLATDKELAFFKLAHPSTAS